MTGNLHQRLRRSGTCSAQGQQRGVMVPPVVVSVWNKKTGSGDQN